MNNAGVWAVDDYRYQLETGSLAASLDAAHPAEGLRQLRVTPSLAAGGHDLELTLLGVLVTTRAALPRGASCSDGSAGDNPSRAELIDSYCRGRDVIATYSHPRAGAVQSQVYWRFLSSDDWSGIEAIVSVQTDLLDANPVALTRSEICGDQILWLRDAEQREYSALEVPAAATLRVTPADGAGLLLVRLGETGLSYLEMVHPADFLEAEITGKHGSPGRWGVGFLVFPDRIEKGVIRRARVRGVFLPRQDDESRAAQLYEWFRKSPPPLTA